MHQRTENNRTYYLKKYLALENKYPPTTKVTTTVSTTETSMISHS